MNISSPKNRFTRLSSQNQINIPDFLKIPPPKVYINIKENVGSVKDNRPEFTSQNNHMPLPIEKKKYSNKEQTFPDLDCTDDILFEPIANDLFNTLYPDDPNMILNSNLSPGVSYEINDENNDSLGILYPYDSVIPSYSTTENIPIRQAEIPKNNLGQNESVYPLPRRKVNTVTTNNHILLPIVEEWINQLDTSDAVKSTNRSKLKKFISFLITERENYPTKDNIRKYSEGVRKDPQIKHSSNYNYTSAVNVFFKWAEDHDKFKNTVKAPKINPTQRTHLPSELVPNWMSILKIALDVWLRILDSDTRTKEQYRNEILNLLGFFISNRAHKKPSARGIQKYYTTGSPKDINSIKAINLFFDWTEKNNIYPNIAINIVPSYISTEQLHILKKEIDQNTIKVTITISDMVRAGFFAAKAMDILNNELILFKIGIQNSCYNSINASRKIYLLKFANFLYSYRITTPRQEDIVAFYNHHLSNQCLSTINRFLTIIKDFFSWTSQMCIYPNIARNIKIRHPRSDRNIYTSILCENSEMAFIPPASAPLIIMRPDI